MFKKLIAWSNQEYSHLPWRKKRTLYTTLVSEIMLQQTTVSTVLGKFENFIQQFPNLEALANASEEELTIAWKGLGYYRRARNLKKAAEYIFHHHKGKFPKTFEELKAVPGIGDYTANAILAIGRDEKALALDANLERVLSRLYFIKEVKGPKLQKKIQKLFAEKKIVKIEESFRDLNEALMDLGRTYCQSRRVSCELCFMKKKCLAFDKGKALELPINPVKKIEKHEVDLLRVICRKKDLVLAYKKDKGTWLEGQYEIPTFILNSTDRKLEQYPKITDFEADKDLPNVKTTITKYKLKNYIIELSQKELKKLSTNKYEWVLANEKGNLSTASLKALKKNRE